MNLLEQATRIAVHYDVQTTIRAMVANFAKQGILQDIALNRQSFLIHVSYHPSLSTPLVQGMITTDNLLAWLDEAIKEQAHNKAAP